MSVAEARTRAVEHLARARNADGSWGYLAGQPGAAEPTLYAAAAGLPVAYDWLASADLGWGHLLLPAALSKDPKATRLRDLSVGEILVTEPAPPNPDADRSVIDQDPTLEGWPWTDGASSWVEPTSWAVISLKRCGLGMVDRVAVAEKMLADRRCADGGWNYGNRKVWGTELESDLEPTGWAAMAVPPAVDVAPALAVLDRVREHRSTLSLSVAILAYVARGRPADELAALLVERQSEDGSFGGRLDRTAIAAVALGAVEEGTHVFAV